MTGAVGMTPFMLSSSRSEATPHCSAAPHQPGKGGGRAGAPDCSPTAAVARSLQHGKAQRGWHPTGATIQRPCTGRLGQRMMLELPLALHRPCN